MYWVLQLCLTMARKLTTTHIIFIAYLLLFLPQSHAIYDRSSGDSRSSSRSSLLSNMIFDSNGTNDTSYDYTNDKNNNNNINIINKSNNRGKPKNVLLFTSEQQKDCKSSEVALPFLDSAKENKAITNNKMNSKSNKNNDNETNIRKKIILSVSRRKLLNVFAVKQEKVLSQSNSSRLYLSKLTPVKNKKPKAKYSYRSRSIEAKRQQVGTSWNFKKKDYCDRYDVDGCSIPLGLPFFYKKRFTPACNRHDICYACGVAYSLTRKTCDEMFRKNMKTSCKKKYLDLSTIHDIDKSSSSNLVQISRHRALFASMIETLDRKLSRIARLHWYRYTQNLNQTDIGTLNAFISVYERKIIVGWLYELSQNKKTKTAFKNLKRSSSFLHDSGDNLLENSILKMRSDSDQSSSKYINDVSFRKVGAVSLLRKIDSADTCFLTCNFFANVYYQVVRLFGKKSYHKTPEFYCDEEFVHECLSPLFTRQSLNRQ